jgi:trehalose/maltose hydrolase-like predicted phosphorylase
MNYTFEKKNNKLMIIENNYNPLFSQKTETLFTQANGYIGVRNCYDFETVGEKRGAFIAGLFNKFDESSTS